MSSAGNSTRHVCRIGAGVVFALFLGISAPAWAQPVPAYSDVPTPAVEPLAPANEDIPESPESYVSEGEPRSATQSAEEVIRMLQNSNGAKPLSIADLALINDAMKRMDYLAQVQRRIGESSAGGFAGGRGDPATRTPAGMAGGGSLMVMRISGSAGQYQALVTNGQQQMIVKEGDMLGSSPVASITMSGVRIGSDSGTTLLPFVSPLSLYGVSTGR